MSRNNVDEGAGVVATAEESIDPIQSEAGDDDEGAMSTVRVDKGGDVITDENEETTEEDIAVSSHAPLSTVTV